MSEEIRKILKNYEKRISALEAILKKKPKRIPREFKGIYADIMELVNEGVFDNPQSLAEVAKELRIRARHYSYDHIGVALLRLVRKRILRRIPEKREGREIFTYIRAT